MARVVRPMLEMTRRWTGHWTRQMRKSQGEGGGMSMRIGMGIDMGIDMGIGMGESACIGVWAGMDGVESLSTVVDRAHTGAALQTRHLRHGRRRQACSTHRKATTLATTTVRLLSLLSLRRAGKGIYHRATQHHLAKRKDAIVTTAATVVVDVMAPQRSLRRAVNCELRRHNRRRGTICHAGENGQAPNLALLSRG